MAVQEGPKPKRRILFSGKVNFDELDKNEAEMAAVLEKLEQKRKMVVVRGAVNASNIIRKLI